MQCLKTEMTQTGLFADAWLMFAAYGIFLSADQRNRNSARGKPTTAQVDKRAPEEVAPENI